MNLTCSPILALVHSLTAAPKPLVSERKDWQSDVRHNPLASGPTMTVFECPHGPARSKHLFSPRSVDELLRARLEYPQSEFIADATDLGLWMTRQHKALPVMVSLAAVAVLGAVVETAGAIPIGGKIADASAQPRR